MYAHIRLSSFAPGQTGTLQKLHASLECSMRDFCAVLRQEPQHAEALFYRGTLWKEMQRPDDGIRGEQALVSNLSPSRCHNLLLCFARV